MEKIDIAEKVKTPSDYLEFLRTDAGKEAFIDLRKAVDYLKPFKNKMIISFIAGIAISVVVYLLFKSFLGLLALIPFVYFMIVYMREQSAMDGKQRKFSDELNKFILGDGYLQKRTNTQYFPKLFMKGLDTDVSVSSSVYRNLGKYGDVLNLSVTRKYERKVDGKTETRSETSKEFGNLLRLPSQSFLLDDKGYFYFKGKKSGLLGKLGIEFKGKRSFSFTDTELDEMFDGTVGKLADLFGDDYDTKLEWTKAITPYFESVIKSLVAKYGKLNFAIEDNYFFINFPGECADYETNQYGDLDKVEYRKSWSGNKEAQLSFGKTSPKSVMPYLYRIFLNKIMHSISLYFFCDHQEVGYEELEEAKYILEYTVNEYNNLYPEDITDEYNDLKEEILNV